MVNKYSISDSQTEYIKIGIYLNKYFFFIPNAALIYGACRICEFSGFLRAQISCPLGFALRRQQQGASAEPHITVPPLYLTP